MDEKKTVPGTSEPNPNGNTNEVNLTDLEGGNPNPNPNPAEAGTNGGQGDGSQNPSDDGQKQPPKQTRETDAEFAERRRKQQQREHEEALRRKREEEIRRQAVFDVKSSQVTAEELAELGLQKVETEDQLFLVESLRKAKAEGVENPQATAYQALYRKQEQERVEEQSQAKAKQAELERVKAIVAADQAAFKAKFNKTTAEAIKEPKFMEKFGDLIDQSKGNLTKLYSIYMEYEAQLAEAQAGAGKAQGSIPTNGGRTNGQESAEKKPQTYDEWLAKWKSKHKI